MRPIKPNIGNVANVVGLQSLLYEEALRLLHFVGLQPFLNPIRDSLFDRSMMH